jgi:hypothetical protein
VGRERGYPLGARGFSVRRRLRGWLRPAPTSPILRRSPASKREEKAVTSGRSTECPAMGDTVRELLDIISAGRNCRSGRAGAVKPCASGAPLTRPWGLTAQPGQTKGHPCLDRNILPIVQWPALQRPLFDHLTGCRNERRRGRAVTGFNASCRRANTNALSSRRR